MSNHEPSAGESDVVGVLSRALSNAQKETGELKNRVQELEESARGTVSQAEHSALRNAYDFERANSRKLEQTLKNHEAEAKRREASLAEERAAMQEQLFGVQQQAESLVCQASNEIRGALAHRALALQERGTLEMALYASNTEAHTAQVQLEELLLQHVELKKRYEALVSKRNSSSPRLPLETSSDEEGFPTLAKLKMNERIENLTQSAAKVKELNAKLASVNHDLEASLKARLKLQAQCSELNTANTALTARLREMAQSYTSAKAENTEQVASFEKTIADLRVQLAESEARARTKIKQEQQEIFLSPQSGPPVSPPNERQRYLDFMAPFKAPSLSRRLPFEDNQPIINAREAQDIIHASVWKHERPYLFLPNRTIWCTPNREHALTFAPVLEVNQNARAASNPAQRWVPHSAMLARCGREFELFALGDAERGMGNLLFYMGTYRVHSMRGVVAPGSVAPTDVCPLTIERAMKLNSSTATREKLTLRDLYPDGLARTECFGLQCFGFDWELYRSLRARSKIPVQVQSLKRVWVEGPHAKGLGGGVAGKEKDKKKGTARSRRIAPLPHTSSNNKPPSIPFFAQTSSRAALTDGLGLPTKPPHDANEDERSVLLGRDLRVLAPMHDPMESVVVPERKPALSWTTRARPPVDDGWAGRRRVAGGANLQLKRKVNDREEKARAAKRRRVDAVTGPVRRVPASWP